MTAQELFNLTVANMGMTPSNAQTLLEIYLPNLNTILADTFKLENNNRLYNDLPILTSMPTVTSLNDVLTYQENVIRNVVMLGVARQLALADDDVKSSSYAFQYTQGYNNESKTINSDITDYYSVGE